MGDVVCALLKQPLLDSIFEPQPVYGHSELLALFQALAHASIMKLSENSMSKLFDLMTMGLKYQVLAAGFPPEILHITRNHLDEMRKIVSPDAHPLPPDSPVLAALAYAEHRIEATYADLTYGDWMLVRQTLMAFFQDRRVKVSLFLANNVQNSDGTFFIHALEGVTPPTFNVPGTIIYAPSGATASFAPLAEIQPCTIPAHARGSPYGMNMYAEATQAATENPDGSSGIHAHSRARRRKHGYSKSNIWSSSASATTKVPLEKLKKRKAAAHAKAARSELNALAAMLGTTTDGSHSSSSTSSPANASGGVGGGGTFSINLFPDLGDEPGKTIQAGRNVRGPGMAFTGGLMGASSDSDDDEYSDDDDAAPSSSGTIFIDAAESVGATHSTSHVSSILEGWDDGVEGGGGGGGGDANDLLDLMDGL